MSLESEEEEYTQEAITLLQSGSDGLGEIQTWHGGLSLADLILLPFGISAEAFVAAKPQVRNLALDHLGTVEKQRVIRSVTLCFLVALGFVALIDPQWRLVAWGGVAIKAGIDLGRFRARRGALVRARSLDAGDLELTEPKIESVSA